MRPQSLDDEATQSLGQRISATMKSDAPPFQSISSCGPNPEEVRGNLSSFFGSKVTSGNQFSKRAPLPPEPIDFSMLCQESIRAAKDGSKPFNYERPKKPVEKDRRKTAIWGDERDDGTKKTKKLYPT